MKTEFDLQPTLHGTLLTAQPLQTNDFEELFSAASDPKIWEQHPNPLRYQREVFRNFFDGAIASGGAFLLRENNSQRAIGSSRFYDYDPEKSRILIGYTFLACTFWGGFYNGELKKIMLDHAFQFVDNVHFHIGSQNIRSQIAMERLGGFKVDEINVPYYGEKSTLNFIYEINKDNWRR
ncbi:MAG: GNAT family N-acetyltransferase [Flavobacteriales bacterium]